MIRTVGIISRPRREQVVAVAPKLIKWLNARKLQILYDEQTAVCLPDKARLRPLSELAAAADLLIVLGGDGTLLAAARVAAPRGVPILPVNLGGLGFLTSVTQEDLYPILEDVLAGRHKISERAMLAAETWRGGKAAERQLALNEAVINKGTLSRMIYLDLHIDGASVCRYRAESGTTSGRSLSVCGQIGVMTNAATVG